MQPPRGSHTLHTTHTHFALHTTHTHLASVCSPHLQGNSAVSATPTQPSLPSSNVASSRTFCCTSFPPTLPHELHTHPPPFLMSCHSPSLSLWPSLSNWGTWTEMEAARKSASGQRLSWRSDKEAETLGSSSQGHRHVHLPQRGARSRQSGQGDRGQPSRARSGSEPQMPRAEKRSGSRYSGSKWREFQTSQVTGDPGR